MQYIHRALVDLPLLGTTTVLIQAPTRELSPDVLYSGETIPHNRVYSVMGEDILESTLVDLKLQ